MTSLSVGYSKWQLCDYRSVLYYQQFLACRMHFQPQDEGLMMLFSVSDVDSVQFGSGL